MIDVSGMNYFWKVFDLLCKDQEPDQECWGSLFATPGYSVLTKSEFSPEFFMEKWRLAFQPNRREERKKALDKGDPFLKHYFAVLENKEELKAYQERVLKEEGLLSRAKELALKYLPSGSYPGYPPVSLVVFQFDARGYNPVVIDLLAALKMQEVLIPFLAHEFHHYYRNKTRKQLAGPEHLLWVIDQIHAEGTADLLDKGPRIKEGDPQIGTYKQLVEDAPEYLKFLNDRLLEMGKDKEKVLAEEKILREKLPQSGHPVGYHMAELIRIEFGIEKIRSEVSDPLAFFWSFHQAEIKAGLSRTLTPEAIKILESLLQPNNF